jgi:hypothetical protein
MTVFDNFPKVFRPTDSATALDVASHIARVFRDQITGPFAPVTPFLKRDVRVASIGSCFAEELSKGLVAEGLDATHMAMSERWNSAFALHYFLRRMLHGTPFPDGFVVDPAPIEQIQPEIAARFAAANVFVLTFGLSLCWFRRSDGHMVLEPKITATKAGLNMAVEGYEMRQTNVADNEAAIAAAVDAIKSFKPDATVVLTLSPVPMLATLGVAVIPGNIVSKSTLRVALNNFMARALPGVFYWPSYECVTWMGTHVAPSFGGKGNDMRHVRPDVVRQIAHLFKEYYFLAN